MILDEIVFRCRNSNISSKYHGESKELVIARSGVSTRSISSEKGLSRRDLVLIGLSSPLSMLLPLSSPGNALLPSTVHLLVSCKFGYIVSILPKNLGFHL